MRVVEVSGITGERFRQVLFERRRAGESRRIQPARHCHDHQAPGSHDEKQHDAMKAVGDQRHEPEEEGPEGVDGDRHRGRIDDGAEEHEGRAAVEQAAHAEVGIDARGERQHRQREARHGLDAAQRLGQPDRIRFEQHGVAPSGINPRLTQRCWPDQGRFAPW